MTRSAWCNLYDVTPNDVPKCNKKSLSIYWKCIFSGSEGKLGSDIDTTKSIILPMAFRQSNYETKLWDFHQVKPSGRESAKFICIFLGLAYSLYFIRFENEIKSSASHCFLKWNIEFYFLQINLWKKGKRKRGTWVKFTIMAMWQWVCG